MTTTYTAEIGNGQKIYLQNQGQQTLITLSSAAPGQQQQQSHGFTTEKWTAPPTLFRTAAGAIVRVETAQGPSFVQVQSNNMQSLTAAPALTDAEVIPLQQTTQATSPPISAMQPMQPMQPMKMGDMEMQMNPMQMRMGNMEMRMGSASSPQSSSPQASTRLFCTQCGHDVRPEDRFCAHCGHSLQGS